MRAQVTYPKLEVHENNQQNLEEEDLRQIYQQYFVQEIQLQGHYAFITFKNIEDAQKALDETNGKSQNMLIYVFKQCNVLSVENKAIGRKIVQIVHLILLIIFNKGLIAQQEIEMFPNHLILLHNHLNPLKSQEKKEIKIKKNKKIKVIVMILYFELITCILLLVYLFSSFIYHISYVQQIENDLQIRIPFFDQFLIE